ncbi:ATP-binding cassette domain-containing protein [Alteribacillus iranensis]|uniref:Energy-coupling factor transport system ATP-binding protein n=1 Tax=Alteribacillus iranensis TaxID=930128 RepID=A0A1I2F6L9_9BACI|nr:ATP-binding cassette domain-containing protein [Alteribacillus iranensis]SFF00368.1 energy-coupling factor transport system ATP-binding protein [Alteribacillus iranensis]
MTAVSFNHVSFRYEEESDWVLEDVNAEIEEGEWVSIIGPNGSGKSTLSRMCNGLLSPVEGEVFIEGKPVRPGEELALLRQKVGMVFQNPDHQFVAPTVKDDIAFGMENAGVPRNEMVERIEKAAMQTGIEKILDAEPHRLSGGQKQRVAIAGTLVLHPTLLILDEATSMLDPQGKREVMNILKDLHRRDRITILHVTHDLREAAIGTRIWLMRFGNIAIDLDSNTMLDQMNQFDTNDIPLPYEFHLLQELRRRHCKEEAGLVKRYIRDGIAL